MVRSVSAQVVQGTQEAIDDAKIAQEVKVEKGTVQSVKSELRRAGFSIEKSTRKRKQETPAQTSSTLPKEASQTTEEAPGTTQEEKQKSIVPPKGSCNSFCSSRSYLNYFSRS